MALFNSRFSNWQEAFNEAVHSLGGIVPENVIADGKIHRFSFNGRRGNDSGWYVVYQDEVTGGSVGNWGSHTKVNWYYADKGYQWTPEKESVWEKKNEQRIKELEQERIEAQSVAAIEANKRWGELTPPDADHPYLKLKGVKAHGIRQGKQRLYVPLMNEVGDIVSLQSIDDAGKKLFMKGGRAKGCYFFLGTLKDKIYIAEGYATASSIHEATGEAVAVTFSIGNFLPVIEFFKTKHSNARLIMCADNDSVKNVENFEHAQGIAKGAGIQITWPDFTLDELDHGATDFNDYHKLRGLDALKVFFEVKKPNKFRLMSIGDIEQMTPPEWLIEGVFTEKSFGVIYGAPKRGKTFVALDMGLCVASGKNWHDQAVRQGNVLYMAGEGVGGLKKRIKAWMIKNEASSELPFYVMPTALNASSPEDLGEFLRLIDDASIKFSMIFIDTVARAMLGADENSSKDMGEFISTCDRIKEYAGATVVGIHHSGKNEDLGMRGSNALLGAIDSSIRVSKDEDIVTVKFEDQKDDEPLEDITFKTEVVSVGISGSSLVLVKTDIEADKAVKLSPTEKLAFQILCDAIGDEKYKGMPSVKIDLWRAECYRRELTIGDFDAKRIGFNTASKRLRQKGVIGLENDRVFIIKNHGNLDAKNPLDNDDFE